MIAARVDFSFFWHLNPNMILNSRRYKKCDQAISNRYYRRGKAYKDERCTKSRSVSFYWVGRPIFIEVTKILISAVILRIFVPIFQIQKNYLNSFMRSKVTVKNYCQFHPGKWEKKLTWFTMRPRPLADEYRESIFIIKKLAYRTRVNASNENWHCST